MLNCVSDLSFNVFKVRNCFIGMMSVERYVKILENTQTISCEMIKLFANYQTEWNAVLIQMYKVFCIIYL